METLDNNTLNELTKEQLVKIVQHQGVSLYNIKAELQAKDESIKIKDAKIKSLEAYILQLRAQLYGKKSEKHLPSNPDAIQLTLNLFSDEEKENAEKKISEIEEKEKESLIKVSEHTRRSHHRTIDYSSLEVRENIITPQEVIDAPQNYVLVGQDVTDTLVTVPERVYIQRDIRLKYALKATYQKEDSTKKAMVIAPLPKEIVFPGCLAHVTTLADIIIQKYFYHIPHHRVLQQYKEAGVTISSSTINEWFNMVCDLMNTLYNVLRRHLFKSTYIHCDESAFSVYNEGSHKVQNASIWAMSDARGPDVVFQYEYGKKNCEIAKRLLGSFNGVIQTDASSLYEQFENDSTKIMLGCWVHCRRYYKNALNEAPQDAQFAIGVIDKLYTIEHNADIDKVTDAERKERRRKIAYPLIVEFEKWLYSIYGKYPEKSPMAKAVNYTLTHLPKLSRYVNEGWYKLDNNDIELCIRPLKVGLNNYGYCHNDDAAYRAAMMYSFIATCNKADVNPREWLEDVMPLVKAAKTDKSIDLETLLPGEWKKSHPTSHALVHHLTEEEHISEILKSRAKRASASKMTNE